MAVEVELKAHIGDAEALKKRLSEIAVYGGEYTKNDDYWLPAAGASTGFAARLPKSGVRLRREKSVCGGVERDAALVTYKTKESRSNIEVNRENEFALSPPEGSAPEEACGAFEGLLRLCGFEKSYSKVKKGFFYCYKSVSGDIRAEVSLVGKLGWFLEIEILLEDDEAEGIRRAKGELLAFLKLAGVGEDKIETRYYSEMLSEV